MQPPSHIITSFSLGILIWLLTKSVYAGAIFFVTGVLIDLDHVIEYIIHHGLRTFTLKNLLISSEHTGKQEGALRFKKLYLVLHSSELAVIFWTLTIFTKNLYLLAFTASFTIHLILDYVGNPGYAFSYFIIWRFIKGFRTERLFRKRSG